MKKEIFKDIPGYEGYYQISNLGNIKSIERVIERIDGFKRRVGEFIMTPTFIKGETNKYIISLRKNNKTEIMPLDRAMLLAFYEDYEIGTHKIIYKDGNRHNVTLDNLTFEFFDGRYGGNVTVKSNNKKDKHFRSIAQAGKILKFDHSTVLEESLKGKKGEFTIEFDVPFVYKKKTIKKIKA